MFRFALVTALALPPALSAAEDAGEVFRSNISATFKLSLAFTYGQLVLLFKLPSFTLHRRFLFFDARAEDRRRHT